MGRIIRNQNTRINLRLQKALAAKPSASDVNRKGLTPEEINKMFGKGTNPNRSPSKQKSKTKINKALNAVEFKPIKQAPIHAAIIKEIPDWFEFKGEADVSIIVPMYKSAEVIAEQILSWDLESDGLTKEIIYVDDQCPHNSPTQVIKTWTHLKEKYNLKFPNGIGKIYKNDINSGYGPACNVGARYASGKYLIFLNADTTVTKNWVKPMIDCFEDPSIGIVGNMQLKANGTIDSAGSEWSWQTKTFEHIGRNILNGKKLVKPFLLVNAPKEILVPAEREMVTGCCFAMPRTLFRNINGFDPGYRVGYWEDSDINMRVKLGGYKVWFQPESKIYHLGGHSNSHRHPHLMQNMHYFNTTWVESRLIDAFVTPKRQRFKTIDKNKIIVYTAISNGYDSLKDTQVKDDIRFVAFTDDPTIKSDVWEIKPIHTEFKDPNRNAKIHKVQPNLYFPDYDYTLWIDGSVNMHVSAYNLIRGYMADDVDMLIFQHPERGCLYQEGEVCIKYELDDATTIKKQLERYKKEGYSCPDDKNQFVEATIILRRNNETVRKFDDLWWREICQGSKRDQISFNYVANKVGLKYAFFPGFLRERHIQNSKLFSKQRHSKKR